MRRCPLARQKLEVTLETVTPLFLAGADGKTPELRPASFRGAMRFWLRALLGGVLGDDLEAVRREEARVFGDTEGASPVVVQVRTIEDQPPVKGSYRPLLHNPQKGFRFPGFKEGQMFDLVLSSRPGAGPLPEIAVASTLLFCHLGSLGKRARRGFGSLQIIKGRGNKVLSNVPDFAQLVVPKPKDAPALNKHLSRMLEWSCEIALVGVERPSPLTRGRLPEFSILSPDHTKVLVCEHVFGSWETAMVEFWRKLRATPYRDRKEFGFVDKREGRRSSPLVLKIWRLDPGYHLVFTAFRARLSHRIGGHWEVVTRFLDECRNDWGGEYVMGGSAQW